jgi:hypothetical protein
MKNQLWLLQKRLTVRAAHQEISTATSKSRVTSVFPKKLLSLKIQWNKSRQLGELPRILLQLKPLMLVMSVMVINSTTRWTPDKVALEGLLESAATMTFVILSQIAALMIASVKRSIPTTFVVLQIHALLMTSSEVAGIRSVCRLEDKSAAIRRVRTARSTVITVHALTEAIECQIPAGQTMIVSIMTFTSA